MATTPMPIEAVILFIFCCLVCRDVFFCCATVGLLVPDFFFDEARLVVPFFAVCLAVLVTFLLELLVCLVAAFAVLCAWLVDFVAEWLVDLDVACVVAVLALVFWTVDALVTAEVCRLTLELAIAGTPLAFITTPNP